MIRELVYWPHEALRRPARPVKKVTERTKILCLDLIDTMEAHGAAGIAAPQVGVASRVFVINWQTNPSKLTSTQTFINPEIIETGEEKEVDVEGCLSFPEIFLKISRPLRVVVRALDINAKEFTLEAQGFLARAVQHELDHLNSRLMIDFFGRFKREMIEKKMLKWKKRHGFD